MEVQTWVGDEDLVDDDVVRVNVELGQLLHQPLRFEERQELGDAHAHERRSRLPNRRTGQGRGEAATPGMCRKVSC